MPANAKIFCNVPWTKLHVTPTGTYSPCCVMQYDHFHTKISDMDPIEWFHSPQANDIRRRLLEDEPLPECSKCYYRESIGYESGRIRDNHKSMIFPEPNFQRSFAQSPWHDEFIWSERHGGATDLCPTDFMISLGNECNLACKMCPPIYSSKVSSRYESWNLLPSNLKIRNNWSANDDYWQRFLKALDLIPRLERLAFIGGEPLINKRFYQIIDRLLDSGRTDCDLHFVTNATIFNQMLVAKLGRFRSCTIEFSIESIDSNNHYIRQGSDTESVKANILQYQQQLAGNGHFVISSAPQALSINTYDRLISWALDHRLPIQGHVVVSPEYLHISVLPYSIRQHLIPRFQTLLATLEQDRTQQDGINFGIDPNRVASGLATETRAMLTLLTAPEPANVRQLQQTMIEWMMRWDRVTGLDARDHFPEYREWLQAMDYHV